MIILSNRDGQAVTNGVREKLTSNRTYYVRTDGSDYNDGLTNNSTGAFLTMQKAVNTVCNDLDSGPYQTTIQCAAGTYTGTVALKAYVGSVPPIIQGDSSSTSSVVVSVTSNSGFSNFFGGTWHIRYMKVQTTTAGYGIYSSRRGQIFLTQVNFGACADASIAAFEGGEIDISGSFTISGGSKKFLYIGSGSRVQWGGGTVTITGTPAFTEQFAYIYGSWVQIYNPVFSGSATGTRYGVVLNGILYVVGAGINYLPGNVAGTTATGGQYN